MKVMSRMMVVGALVAGGSIAHANGTATNYNCPGDGYAELTLYDQYSNYETFCVHSGSDPITIDLSSTYYYTGNAPGSGPVTLPWTGNVYGYTFTFSSQSAYATFSIPRTRFGAGCSQTYNSVESTEQTGLPSCVEDADTLVLGDDEIL